VEAAPKPTLREHAGSEVLHEGEAHRVTFRERHNGLWPGEFRIRVLANPDRYSIEEWVTRHPIEDVSGGNLIMEKNTCTLGGKPAFRLSIFGFDHEEIAVIAAIDGEEILDISFAGINPNDPEARAHRRIYDAMVASFRFIKRRNPRNR
jgi:hypothetical protein